MLYQFGQRDFDVSIKTIKLHLSNAMKRQLDSVPWKCLKVFIGEVN